MTDNRDRGKMFQPKPGAPCGGYGGDGMLQAPLTEKTLFIRLDAPEIVALLDALRWYAENTIAPHRAETAIAAWERLMK